MYSIFVPPYIKIKNLSGKKLCISILLASAPTTLSLITWLPVKGHRLALRSACLEGYRNTSISVCIVSDLTRMDLHLLGHIADMCKLYYSCWVLRVCCTCTYFTFIVSHCIQRCLHLMYYWRVILGSMTVSRMCWTLTRGALAAPYTNERNDRERGTGSNMAVLIISSVGAIIALIKWLAHENWSSVRIGCPNDCKTTEDTSGNLRYS